VYYRSLDKNGFWIPEDAEVTGWKLNTATAERAFLLAAIPSMTVIPVSSVPQYSRARK
jgi:hypothetical protein